MEPNLNGEPYVSQSDSEVFGFPIARANAPQPDSIARAEEFCRNKGVKLLIVRCPVSTLDVAHALTKSGYLLMDTLRSFFLLGKDGVEDRPEEPDFRAHRKTRGRGHGNQAGPGIIQWISVSLPCGSPIGSQEVR